MESEGWNYDNADDSAKNLFIFQDWAHRNLKVQQKLLEEISTKFLQNYFKVLFIEGCFGVYKIGYSRFETEVSVMMGLERDNGGWNAVEILSHRCSAIADYKNLVVYGVDDPILHKKNLETIKGLYSLVEKIKRSRDRVERFAFEHEWNQEWAKFLDAANRRSRASVRKIIDVMDKTGVNNAGLVYGKEHFELMARLIKQNGLGYITYCPGEIEISPGENLDYIRRLVERSKR
jgi:hypothetical protein